MRSVFEQVSFGESEVYNVDSFGILAASDDKIVGFDIAVDVALVVDELDAFDHLQAHHQGGFEVEAAAVVDEEVLEGLAEQVHHHHVVLVLGADVVGVRDAVIDCVVVAGELREYSGLIEELQAFAS
jgi:uncharacterized protein (UPF0264 family)